MALMSPPIAVASAALVRFSFRQFRSSVNVQVVFYSDAEGTAQIAGGTGLRDVTAYNESDAFEGPFTDRTAQQSFVSTIDEGTLLGMVDLRWYQLFLGAGMQNVLLSGAVNVNPGGAVTYRIVVESAGESELV